MADPIPTIPPAISPEREAAIARLKAQGAWNAPLDRRRFFSTAAAGWALFTAGFGGLSAIFGAFMAPRVDFGKAQTFRAGPPDKYPPNSVSEEYKSSQRAWIVRDSDKIFVLSTVCTHLGCTPNWSDNEGKFKCPCHGSGFYGPHPGVLAGVNFEGPAPRPLERYKIMLTDDGQILVDKSRKFLQEKGEWDNPESFIAC
jgi:cytochrome b6-f complex iron-sulfur subunit